MARKHGKDRGILEKPKGSSKWWVRIFTNGRERWYRADNKSQARALYGRLKADIREGKYFPEKFKKTPDITLKAWVNRCLEGSTNRGIQNEKRYGKFWKLLLGKRLINEITTEELRRIQFKMKERENRKAATINRHFSFLRHVLQIAFKDGKIDRNPISGVRFFPEVSRTRYLTDLELEGLKNVMGPEDWKLIAFAINTGLRRGEQFNLRWDQISFESKTITLPLPKGGRTRHVPLNEEALKILRSLNSLLSPWVFPRKNKQSLPESAQFFVNTVYTPALKISGHKTVDVFNRYDIVSEDDVKEAGQRLTSHINSYKKVTIQNETKKEHSPTH